MVVALAVALTVGLATVTAESEDTDVDIEIDDTTQLDVKPDQMDYTSEGPFEQSDLSPGDQREISDRGHSHIDIENIGSDRLDEIYAEPKSLHSEQPFGTESGTVEHNTANLVLMSTDTASSDYDIADRDGLEVVDDMHYLTRVEYFEDQPPEYIQVAEEDSELDFDVDVGADPDPVDGEVDNDKTEVGQFRVGEASYYFVRYITETDENEILVVGNTPETPTDLGTYDFTGDGDDYTVIGLDDGGSGYSSYEGSFDLASIDVDEYDSDGPILDGDSGIVDSLPSDLDDADVEERSYNFYIGDEEVVRASFNVDVHLPGTDTETNIQETGGQQYILEANDQSDALQPGENFPVDFGVQLPNGIDHESITEGTVTFNAEAYND